MSHKPCIPQVFGLDVFACVLHRGRLGCGAIGSVGASAMLASLSSLSGLRHLE